MSSHHISFNNGDWFLLLRRLCESAQSVLSLSVIEIYVMSLRAKRSNLKYYHDVRGCFVTTFLAMTAFSDRLCQ